ncbi:Transducin (beta)-like 3, partial [Bonamia ostreae]
MKEHVAKIKSILFACETQNLLSASDDLCIKKWPLAKFLTKNQNPQIENGDSEETNETSSVDTVKIASDSINSVAISDDEKYVAVARTNPAILVLDFDDLKVRGELNGHRKAVWDVKFLQREKILLSCSSDKTVRVWSLRNMSCLK